MKHLRNAMLTLLATLWTASTASAYPVDQCAADRYGDDLGCTAGDVSITGMSVVGDTTSCVGGTDITLDLQLTVNFAVPNRWDIGIFISNDGESPQTMSANGGAATCSVSVLPNSNPFLDLDEGGVGDTCGDGNKNIGGGTGSGIHFMPNVTVPCQALAGSGGQLYIPFVVSWDNQASPTGGTCASNADPVPNTKSKCNSPTIAQGSVAVVVLPTITKDDGIDTLFSGATTSYDVVITNTTGATLSGVVFTDPLVTGISVTAVSCSAAGGASCPTTTVADMQGSGITLPDMPVNSALTFTIDAALTGSPGDQLTNTATVTASSQSLSATDTNIIVDTIAILPTTQSKSSDKNATVTYTYTLYNFDSSSADTITVSAISSQGWTVAPTPSSVLVPAGGSTTLTLEVDVPAGANVGDVDTTIITATSGNNPSKSATATAVTTVTEVLTLVPSNTGSGGAGASVYYLHQVQNHSSASKSISLTPSFLVPADCSGWTTTLYETDYTTALSSPVTLASNGGYKDFVLKVTIPSTAASNDSCTTTLTAAYSPSGSNAVSVTDITTVKNLILYEDPGYTTTNDVYPAGNNVYAKGFGLDTATSYEYRWYDAGGTEVCTPRLPSTTGTTFPDTCTIPTSGPLGTWTVQIWDTTNDVLFVQNKFYVGPDHLQASYSGTSPSINTNTVIDLALHDRYNHVVPYDSSSNLVKGDATDPEGPLMITVSVSGSAQIVASSLSNYTITGQSITGKLSSTDGTATITIQDSIEETVTITPESYKGVLYGSPDRDEPVSVTFISPPLDHYTITHAGTGVTCDYLAVTFTAYASSDESTPTAPESGTTITLSTSQTVDGWYALSGGSYTLLAGNSYTFDGSSNNVTLYLKKGSVATDIDIDLIDSSGATENDTSTDTTIDMWANFNNALLQFVEGTSGGALSTAINDQVGGKPSSTAPNNQNLFLRAVKTDLSTGACVPSLDGTTQSVSLGFQCIEPATCLGDQLTLKNALLYDGATATTIPANNGSGTANTTAVALTFDANGLAPLSFQYDNIGNLSLYAADLTVSGTTLSGNSSEQFIVKPQALLATASDATPYKAGVGGGIDIQALLWDSDNSVLSDNPVATQFGNETTPQLSFSYASSGPANGNASIEGNALPLTSSGTTTTLTLAGTDYTNGVANLALNWDEVGTLTLTSASNYLGSGSISTTTDVPFVPYDLRISVSSAGTFLNTHTSGATDFTYLGESFGYTVNPQFTVEAVAYCALAPCTVTTNYAGTWASKISASTLPTTDQSGTDNGQNWTLSGISYTPSAFVAGVATVTFDALTSYTKPNDPVAPFTSNIDPSINISLTTSDGLTKSQALTFDTIGNLQRFGRAVLTDTYGPADLSLPMIYYTEYYDGSGFIPNADDLDTLLSAIDLSCVAAFTCSVDGSVADLQISGTNIIPGGNFILTPSTSLNGIATIQLTVPDWLTFDWDSNSATPATHDTGSASFGLYRGDDRFYYWREER